MLNIILLWYNLDNVFSFSDYASISYEDAVFILGGRVDNRYPVSTIARYKNDKWEKVGNLMTARCALGAIKYGSYNVIIGGNAFKFGPNNIIQGTSDR